MAGKGAQGDAQARHLREYLRFFGQQGGKQQLSPRRCSYVPSLFKGSEGRRLKIGWSGLQA